MGLPKNDGFPFGFPLNPNKRGCLQNYGIPLAYTNWMRLWRTEQKNGCRLATGQLGINEHFELHCNGLSKYGARYLNHCVMILLDQSNVRSLSAPITFIQGSFFFSGPDTRDGTFSQDWWVFLGVCLYSRGKWKAHTWPYQGSFSRSPTFNQPGSEST